MSHTPSPTNPIPIRKTHFGIRHARSIPSPMAISTMPPSHLMGAPLHLLRIPIPPLIIDMHAALQMCKKSSQPFWLRASAAKEFISEIIWLRASAVVLISGANHIEIAFFDINGCGFLRQYIADRNIIAVQRQCRIRQGIRKAF